MSRLCVFPVALVCVITISYTAILAEGADVEEIAKGSLAKLGDWPWVAAVKTDPLTHLMGATLITPRVLVTAASAIIYVNASTLSAHFGFTDLSMNETGDQVIGVSSYLIHPAYNPSTRENDIALVYLSERVTYNQNVKKMKKLSSDRKDKLSLEKDTECVVLGAGYEVNHGLWTLPLRLNVLRVNPIDNDRCQFLLKLISTIHPSNYCTTNKQGGFCVGDFGGPLACRIDDSWTLVGIQSVVNFYDGCKRGTKVYTRISSFKSWIKDNLD